MKDRYALLDHEFWVEQGGASGWAELLATPEEAQEARRLRRCAFAGRPYGEEAFVALFEKHFQRAWRKWGTERASRADTIAI